MKQGLGFISQVQDNIKVVRVGMRFAKFLLSVVSFVLFLTSVLSTVIASDNEIIKPKNDVYQYKVVRYPNGFEVVFATPSDPSVRVSVACVCLTVKVGSFKDPSSIPGLAHFLEHALLDGKETDPDESGFYRFIGTNGGATNAATDPNFTHFYFFIPSDKLVEALERFSEFFLSPLFDKDSMEREKKVIDYEHKLNQNSDFRRINSVRREMFDPRHPESKFKTGCAETLSVPDICGEAKRFMKDYWSSHLMKLFVGGPDTPELWKVLKKFERAKRDDHAKSFGHDDRLMNLSKEDRFSLLRNPFGDSAGGKVVKVKRITAGHFLTLTFQLPPLRDGHGYSGLEYFTEILELPSMVQQCKLSGLLTNIETDIVSATDYYTLVEIEAELTDEGFDKYMDVISMVFSMISCIGAGNGLDAVLEDIKNIKNLCFEFTQMCFSAVEMMTLTSDLFWFNPRDFLYARYSGHNADTKKVQRLAEYFKPDRMLAMRSSDGFKDLPEKDRWFEAEYCIERSINPAEITVDGARFKLPPKNPYIATEFPVSKVSSEPMKLKPDRLVTDTGTRVWYNDGNMFKEPRASVRIKIRLPEIVNDQTILMSLVLFEIIEYELFDLTHQASFAQLSTRMLVDPDGIEFWFCGFSQKLPIYIKSFAQAVRRMRLKESVFDLEKKVVADAIKREEKESALATANNAVCQAMSAYAFSHARLEVLSSITLKRTKKFFRKLLSAKQLDIEALVTGSIKKDAAVDAVEGFTKSLFKNLSKGTKVRDQPAFIPLPKNRSSIVVTKAKDSENENHAVFFYVQTGPAKDPNTKAVNRIFQIAFHALAFDTLRTKRTLGYDVSLNVRSIGNYEGISIEVQSASSNPIEIEKAIVEMLDVVIRNALAKMDELAFAAVKKATISAATPGIMDLSRQSDFYWHNISTRSYDFEQDMEHHIRAVSLPEFVKEVDEKILTPGRRARLSAHVWSGSPHFLSLRYWWWLGSEAKVYWEPGELRLSLEGQQ